MKINMQIKTLWFFLSVGSLKILSAEELPQDKFKNLSFGAYLDTYYAYDFNNPPVGDRIYTTQAVRQNEMNVNLAFIEAKYNEDKIHGRLALQAGTAAESAYGGESKVINSSGDKAPTLTQHLQEAYLGYQVLDGLWVDAGTYFSHIGLEGFISRDNWMYTQSLVTQNSPYFQTGLRVSYKISEAWSAQLHVMNGWQRVAENDKDKALGSQLAFIPSDKFSATYNTFIGQEAGFRMLHDLVLKYSLTDSLQVAGQFDAGMQRPSGTTTEKWWYGFSALAKYSFSPNVAVSGRGEAFWDKDGVLTSVTNTSGSTIIPESIYGASLGIDLGTASKLIWRNEFKYLTAGKKVFPTSDTAASQSFLVVTSLALSL